MITNLMLKGYCYLDSLRGQRGVVSWEYLLVVGLVSVGIIVVVVGGATPMTKALVNGVCVAINNVDGTGGINITCPAAA